MTRFSRALGILSATVVALVTQTAVAPTAQAAGAIHGCPYGYVCVYPQNKGWNNARPSLYFYTYGAHNLSSQYGTHRVMNNQYGAWVIECSGYNGGGNFIFGFGPGIDNDENLTPVNSLVLTRNWTYSC